MKTIQEYEIVDHGIEHEQYFQGCGFSYTRFETVSTGIGNNLVEALNDAMEGLVQQGYEISNALEVEVDSLPNSTETEETHTDCDDEECYSQDVYYYASIRVR